LVPQRPRSLGLTGQSPEEESGKFTLIGVTQRNNQAVDQVNNQNTLQGSQGTVAGNFSPTPIVSWAHYQFEVTTNRHFIYDGAVVVGFIETRTDNQGHIVTENHSYTFDNLGRISTDTILRTTQELRGNGTIDPTQTKEEKTTVTNTYDSAGRLVSVRTKTNAGLDGAGALREDFTRIVTQFDSFNRAKIETIVGQVRGSEDIPEYANQTIVTTYYDEKVPGRRSDAVYSRKTTYGAGDAREGEVSYDAVVDLEALARHLEAGETLEQAMSSNEVNKGIEYRNGLPWRTMSISRSLAPGHQPSEGMYIYNITTRVTRYALNGNQMEISVGSITLGNQGELLAPLTANNVVMPTGPTTNSGGTVTFGVTSPTPDVIGGSVGVTVQYSMASPITLPDVAWGYGSDGVTISVPTGNYSPGATITVTLAVKDHNGNVIKTQVYSVVIPAAAADTATLNQTNRDTDVLAAPGLNPSYTVPGGQEAWITFSNSALSSPYNTYWDRYAVTPGSNLDTWMNRPSYGQFSVLQNTYNRIQGRSRVSAVDLVALEAAVSSYADALSAEGQNDLADMARTGINSFKASLLRQ